MTTQERVAKALYERDQSLWRNLHIARWEDVDKTVREYWMGSAAVAIMAMQEEK